MDSSVRRNIALKLKDTSTHKAQEPKQRKEREAEDVCSDSERSEGNLRSQTLAAAKKTQSHSIEELRWDHKVNLIGRPVKDPLLHICEMCSLPILIYGRMKRCRHAFCRDCAKKSGGTCPKCQEGDQQFEEASMGSVYICTSGGGRYDNKGCGRSYLSQRDLEAHIAYRHKDKTQTATILQTSTATNPLTFPIPPFFQAAGIPATFPTPTLPPGSITPGAIPPPPPPSIPQSIRPTLIPTVSMPLQFAGQAPPSLSTAPAPWSRPPNVFK